MVEIELDGRKVEVPPGSMVMHAAEKAGVYVPHFCYHKKLSIAANCRMCLVDVEKAPKPMPACATPVTQGMVVKTKSDKAIRAQQSVMEFLLVNHPLDCPICDQGGECQLQDLAVGYGGSSSRYEEEKRVVPSKDVGPLISMEEMSRCIHCTRCVRFGQEVAGDMELGMSHRGEHSEIETFLDQTIDSELSGNMIDICPVGALTSKPFRYSARTWEMSRRKSISPHDSTGANLVVQVKNHRVMRVLPLENEAVNECWIADRDRFSYEALNGDQRLTKPMLKQGGRWVEVDWQTALEYVANGLRDVSNQHGASAIGTLVSPHCTVEELYLAGVLTRGLGSKNIDAQLRRGQGRHQQQTNKALWLGRSIESLSKLDRVLIVGSDLRKDHPLFAQRIRQSVRQNGAKVCAIVKDEPQWAMNTRCVNVCNPAEWGISLAQVAAVVAKERSLPFPKHFDEFSTEAVLIAQTLLSGQSKAILLGNAAAHHDQAEELLALAEWIGQQTGATVGYLTEAANTVGAQLVGAAPEQGALSAAEMLTGAKALKAVVLLNVEPGQDSLGGKAALAQVAKADLVVSLSPFKSNMDCADVLLPIAPFTETAGSFVNAEGLLQSFHAVVKPLEDARPAWKVMRVLSDLLGIQAASNLNSVADVLATALPGVQSGQKVPSDLLSNRSQVDLAHSIDTLTSAATTAQTIRMPAVASIYQLDALVRRAPSLQATKDGQMGQVEISAGVSS